MATTMECVAAIVEETAERGMRVASASEAVVTFALDGVVVALVASVGDGRYVIAWQYDGAEWSAQNVGEDVVHVETSMTLMARAWA